ncbi:MAG: hypothetical protein DLM59_19215 [Pseudonocardiales bacterium]|nr:MAG: hypothetical protein DLM59_19215 [Pseudonocardiales bacterium]
MLTVRDSGRSRRRSLAAAHGCTVVPDLFVRRRDVASHGDDIAVSLVSYTLRTVDARVGA